MPRSVVQGGNLSGEHEVVACPNGRADYITVAKDCGMAATEDFEKQIHDALDVLKAVQVIFDDGLTEAEIEAVEARYGFRFPPDLRALLRAALPVAIESEWGRDSFPNWRLGDHADLQRRLNWPFEGMAFDIENNAFWMEEWGPRPAKLDNAIEIARQAVQAAPKLIPVCGHRYLPAEPGLGGNPVFSVYQTDIIYYGCDLWDYFENEFAPEEQRWRRFRATPGSKDAAVFRPIRFWSKFTE